MTHRIILFVAMALMFPVVALADFAPTAYYTVDGVDMESTDMITDGEAPLSVTFRANPSNLGDLTPAYEWRFTRSGSQQPYIVRYEETTTYEFREAGSTQVALYVDYGDGAGPLHEATITVTISTSSLEMPNAFSPNGDGVNDIYRAKETHRSIVEFHAYIFNRWGQKLYEWTDVDGGWDGTYKGSPVADGVYYVLVKARGADGVEYDIKRDVNLLRDYIEGGVQ